MSSRLETIVVSAFIAATAAGANLPPPQQITLSGDGRSESWGSRQSPTSQGKILFVGSDDTVRLFDGTNIVPVHATTGQAVDTTSFALGRATTPGQVLAAWRRGAGTAWVSVNGGTPVEVDLNPESVGIADGCMFMVLQLSGTEQHAFQITPANGNRQQVSSGSFVGGVFRIATSKCRAAWTYDPDNSDTDETVFLGYWNGTATQPLDTANSLPFFAGGKLVYTKTVSGIQQVFLVDTDISLTPVQVSNETDPNVILDSPQTDGRHIAWYRHKPTAGTDAQIVLSGGLTFPTAPLDTIVFGGKAFHLDSGQLFWTTAAGGFQYDNGREQFDLDPTPATNATVQLPWLADGYIAFLSGGEVFRVTASTPLAQPQPPLLVVPNPGSALVQWDSIIGATSYNAYIAYEPGVTKDNYSTLTGGRKIEGVTSPLAIPDIPLNTTYYVAITAVENGTEGPSSRTGSTTFIGATQWHSVGELSDREFASISADRVNSSIVFAGTGGSIYKSSDGGIDWIEVLSNATTTASRIRSLAVALPRIYANTNQGTIWRSPDSGTTWGQTHNGSGTGFLGGLVIDPGNSNNVYAGNVFTASPSTESRIIKSVNAGENWTHTAEGPVEFGDIEGNGMAGTPLAIYAGGNGTPNMVKTTDGGANWVSAQIPSGGQIQSIATHPSNPSIIYASTRDKGVYKSMDSGANWTQKVNGLGGVVDDFGGGAEFNSILVDPQDPNLLHLGAGNGYWFSLDGGENWQSANFGFPGGSAWINGLAITPQPHRRLIAATTTGLYMMSFAAAPTVTSISPDSGNAGGGSMVFIQGTGFQLGATVSFGGTTVAGSVIGNTVVATTPAHAAGVVDVVVTNPDFQSATLENGFTYTNTPNVPTNVIATAQSETSILVTWNASQGATSYDIYRRAPGNSNYVLRSSPTTNSFTDTVSAHTSYIYYVRAVNGSGASDESTRDIATSMLFSDDPLNTGTPIRIAHLAENRMAIDHVRYLAGLDPGSFTDAAVAGLVAKALHMTQMRSELDEALAALGLFAGGYFETVTTGVPIRAFHFIEIRNRVK